MANTYSWDINRLDCYPQQDDRTDVVVNVHWTRCATDGEYSASLGDVMGIVLDSTAPYTPYEDLTEAQVIGWLEKAFGPEALANQIVTLDERIENQVNPPIISLPLPWVPAPVEPAPVEPT